MIEEFLRFITSHPIIFALISILFLLSIFAQLVAIAISIFQTIIEYQPLVAKFELKSSTQSFLNKLQDQAVNNAEIFSKQGLPWWRQFLSNVKKVILRTSPMQFGIFKTAKQVDKVDKLFQYSADANSIKICFSEPRVSADRLKHCQELISPSINTTAMNINWSYLTDDLYAFYYQINIKDQNGKSIVEIQKKKFKYAYSAFGILYEKYFTKRIDPLSWRLCVTTICLAGFVPSLRTTDFPWWIIIFYGLWLYITWSDLLSYKKIYRQRKIIDQTFLKELGIADLVTSAKTDIN